MGDVPKRAHVNDCRYAFDGLYEVRLDSVTEQCHDRADALDLASRDGCFAVFFPANNDVADAFA